MKKDKKESIILIARYKRWLERAIKNLVITKKEFKAEFAWSKEATPFKEKKKLKFKPIKKDANWGKKWESAWFNLKGCLLYTSPSPRDQRGSRMPSSA